MWQHVILVEKDSQKSWLMIKISNVIDYCNFTETYLGAAHTHPIVYVTEDLI